MKITVLTDNPNSWIIPYVDKLVKKLSLHHEVFHVYSVKDITKGDILFILSCENIIKKPILDLNKNNIVIHPSKLPEGRGWSPLAWQIIEGKNKIPISLFEATENVDTGDVYILDYIILDGHELNDEIKHLQGEKTIEMIIHYLTQYPLTRTPQSGNPTYYPKRKEHDNELDIEKSIKEQFNLFRIVDNKRYPIYFFIDGIKYKLKIYKD